MRHVGFLVVGSELALDGEQKDLEIPLLLEPKQKQTTIVSDPVSQYSYVLFCGSCVGHAESTSNFRPERNTKLVWVSVSCSRTSGQHERLLPGRSESPG